MPINDGRGLSARKKRLEGGYIYLPGRKDPKRGGYLHFFVDIVSYSLRKTRQQANVINAFIDAMEQALVATARENFDYLHKNRLNVRQDIVVLPLGDGALVAFPFGGFMTCT